MKAGTYPDGTGGGEGGDGGKKAGTYPGGKEGDGGGEGASTFDMVPSTQHPSTPPQSYVQAVTHVLYIPISFTLHTS